MERWGGSLDSCHNHVDRPDLVCSLWTNTSGGVGSEAERLRSSLKQLGVLRGSNLARQRGSGGGAMLTARPTM